MTNLTRAELGKLFPDNPRAVQSFEKLQAQANDTSGALASNTEATGAIQDATVLTLSPNASFNNERVLRVAPDLTAADDGNFLTIGMRFPIRTNGFKLAFNLAADTNIDLPPSGKIVRYAGPYANDAAAASDGVTVGEIYLVTGGALAWRQV